MPPEKGAPSAEGEEKSGGDSVAAGRGAKSKDRRNRKKGKGKGKDAARGKDVAQGQDRSESKKPVLIRSAVVGPSVQAGAVPSSSYSVVCDAVLVPSLCVSLSLCDKPPVMDLLCNSRTIHEQPFRMNHPPSPRVIQ